MSYSNSRRQLPCVLQQLLGRTNTGSNSLAHCVSLIGPNSESNCLANCKPDGVADRNAYRVTVA